jgi:hypothetical protein
LPEAKTRAEIDQLIEAIRDLVLSVPQDQRYYLFGYLDICINCGRDTRGKIRSCQCSNDD